MNDFAVLADPTRLADPAEVLRRVFGFPAFRGQQDAVVRHVLAGGDALVLMPTKSPSRTAPRR